MYVCLFLILLHNVAIKIFNHLIPYSNEMRMLVNQILRYSSLGDLWLLHCAIRRRYFYECTSKRIDNNKPCIEYYNCLSFYFLYRIKSANNDQKIQTSLYVFLIFCFTIKVWNAVCFTSLLCLWNFIIIFNYRKMVKRDILYSYTDRYVIWLYLIPCFVHKYCNQIFLQVFTISWFSRLVI